MEFQREYSAQDKGGGTYMFLRREKKKGATGEVPVEKKAEIFIAFV